MKKEYTEEEKARIANYLNRSKRKPIKVKTGKDSSGSPSIEIHELDELLSPTILMEAVGTPDPDLQTHFLDQAVQTFQGCISSEGFNYDKLHVYANRVIAMLNGIQPRDEIEGMLAVQMVGVHNLAMETLRRAMITGQTFEGKQTNVNEATKMLRTFTAQMEALKRYRTGGQQKVTVEHVHVNEGGQAIVGNVNEGGTGEKKRE